MYGKVSIVSTPSFPSVQNGPQATIIAPSAAERGVTARSNESSSDPTRNIVVIMGKFCQTEIMVEICYESLVRAIGKVVLMKFS